MKTIKHSLSGFLQAFVWISISLGNLACDDEPQVEEKMDYLVIGRGGDMGIGGDEGGDTGGVTGPQSSYLTYTRIYTETGSPARGDLVIFNVDRQEEIWINEGIAKEDMDCVSRGCTLHPLLNWVAWLQPNGGPNDLYVAPINRADRQVEISEKRLVAENVLRYAFTTHQLIYTEIKESEAANGVAVMVEAIDGSDTAREVSLISANGGFATTLSDDLLIIIKTTLSSMNISFLNISNMQIFELFTFGEAGGTGSEFSASTNPVRFAPDNSYLVAVTSNQFMWRVHTLEATDAVVTPVTKDLFPIRNVMDACSGNYPFTGVVNEPSFTADSEHFYLMFNGDCSKRENPSVMRQDYDVYRFSRDLNQAPVNVTNIPKVPHWSNHDITSFSVNSDATKLAFSATQPNRRGSYSIWVMNLGTDGVASGYDCSRGPEMTGLSGDVHCEFITFPGDGVVEYRNLFYTQTAF